MASYPGEAASPQFVASIEANKNATTAPADLVEVSANAAHAAMRRRGGFLAQLTLERSDGSVVSPLYTEQNLAKPKLVASHAMMPVGPHDGVGGQHGFPRWADYRAEALYSERPDFGFAHLIAEVADYPVNTSRVMSLSPGKLILSTCIQNNHPEGSGAMDVSLGEHLYFAMPQGATVGDVTINGETLDQLLHPGAAEQISEGQAQFWRGYAGVAAVNMPDDNAFRLETAIHGHGIQTAVGIGMLLWQRPGEPFICIEPTLGFDQEDGQTLNDGLRIAPGGGVVALGTAIIVD
jgi:hypothetical protein